MAEKVKVSRKIAEFIGDYKNHVNGVPGWEDNLIAEQGRSWLNGFEELKDEAECMKEITPFQLAFILVNGYEVEQTPEEKLIDWFKSSKKQFAKLEGMSVERWDKESREEHYEEHDYYRLEIATLNEVLKILNIKIEEVND